jgi:hypothetical protein
MGVMSMKYGVSVYFCPKLVIIDKTVDLHLCILSKNLEHFKSIKIHIRDRYV